MPCSFWLGCLSLRFVSLCDGRRKRAFLCLRSVSLRALSPLTTLGLAVLTFYCLFWFSLANGSFSISVFLRSALPPFPVFLLDLSSVCDSSLACFLPAISFRPVSCLCFISIENWGANLEGCVFPSSCSPLRCHAAVSGGVQSLSL